MRVMVTGSRDWRNVDVISKALWGTVGDDMPWNWTLIQGCATGADAIARSLALQMGMQVEDYWPDYAAYKFGEANRNRNQLMVASKPDVVLAFPTKRSRGTWHAVNAAKRAGIEVRILQEDE